MKMPDENTTPVGTSQTSQNNQSGTSQSGNDFVLDFGDLGDNAPVTEEIEVDSLSQEEDKADELGFDIDLGGDDQNSTENTDELAITEGEKSVVNDVSAEVSEEENVNDFDISMDYEGTSEEIIPEDNGVVADEEETIPEDNGVVADEEETIPEDNEVVADEEETIPEDNEVVADEEETIPEDNEVVTDEGLNFVKDEDNESKNLEISDNSSEGHLFHQINEDNQNEISFELDNPNSKNDISYADERTIDQPLFTETDDNIQTNESGKENGEIKFDLPELSDNTEGLTKLDMEIPEEKQPELGDLLSNSPIDLSKESNEIINDLESDSGNMGMSVNDIETGDKTDLEGAPQLTQEAVAEGNLDDVLPEATFQEDRIQSVDPVKSNEFLLDIPQVEPNQQNIQQENLQQEVVENSIKTQPEEYSQTDKIIETKNDAVPEMNEQNAGTAEINVSMPVELNDMNSNQRETTSVETEGQVQSTLSLDQILDSELLSNPQYADNSKVSPQNLPVSGGGKTKMGLFIGVGVAALACCVAVLAFPSITSERKPGDAVTTGTAAGYTTTVDPHPSAPDEPTGSQDITTENPQISGISELQGGGVIGGQGSAQAVSFPDDGNDSGDGKTGTEPVPYVWTDDGQSEEPAIQEPVVEEIDVKEILNVISSFKTQGEGYYSFAQGSSDAQLMKYSLRLINLCDNYTDKVNNGEGVDGDSFSSFKSSANKIINKIDVYLGGDEDVPVIREATIDGESSFEGKDEIKDYLYNNR